MSKINMTNNRAMSQGYTRNAIAYDENETLYILIREDADLSGMVKAWDIGAQQWIELNGAFWEFTDDTVDCEAML